MIRIIFSLKILIIANLNLTGQTRIIQGRVISELFEVLPEVNIENIDTLLIGKTDIDGRFKIEIPQDTEKLMFRWVGMELTTIQLNNCDTLEVILMNDVIYDFISSRKIDRLRLKRFKELPTIHQVAHEKGIFITEHQCYEQEFTPIKPELDRIKKNQKNKPSSQ